VAARMADEAAKTARAEEAAAKLRIDESMKLEQQAAAARERAAASAQAAAQDASRAMEAESCVAAARGGGGGPGPDRNYVMSQQPHTFGRLDERPRDMPRRPMQGPQHGAPGPQHGGPMGGPQHGGPHGMPRGPTTGGASPMGNPWISERALRPSERVQRAAAQKRFGPR
jgi:hypothetical protein